jgi:NAD dependent epimerase/dehydratase family enzyme
LILGEAGDELVLAGQRVSPTKLLDAGFEFADRDISSCLEHLTARQPA